MKKALQRLKVDAMLSRGNLSPIPQTALIKIYMEVRPLLDNLKLSQASHSDLVLLGDFYTLASFICDHMQKQTTDEAQGLLQRRKKTIFDSWKVMLAIMTAIRTKEKHKTTGYDLSLIHDGYIASCEIFENATISAYKAAKAEIAQLRLDGAIKAERSKRPKRRKQ